MPNGNCGRNTFPLDVTYQGPGLPRQPIPDAALFRATTEAVSGRTNYLNGLDYRGYQGLWWRAIPDFNHLTAVTNGTTGNFEVARRTRNAHVGLLFNGYLQIAQAGAYTFFTKSSDGSRLFIGKPSISAAVVGQATLPSPRPLASSALPDTNEYFRSVIEGTLTFVDRLQNGTELEVSRGSERVHVIVAGSSKGVYALAPQQRIRATGVCHRLLDMDGRPNGSEFFVQGDNDLHQTETVARLTAAGTNRVLQGDSLKPASEVANKSETFEALTTVAQVYQLSKQETSMGRPVKLHGVVTSIWLGKSVILQDTTRAIFVSMVNFAMPAVGDYCEVEGITEPAFAPYIAAVRVKDLGPASLPEPTRPTWDQLLSGSMHCQYVELEGVVIRNASNSIALLTRGGLLNIQLNPIRPDVPAACDNALIQLRGCLLADYGRQFQNLKVGNIFIDQQWINIVEPGPADIFSIPAKAIADLLLFDPSAGTLQRVKVSGQIIHQDQGEYYLADGTKGLRFLSAGSMDAAVGDQVEVAGFPDWSGSSPVLREAVVRRLGPATVIDPRRLPVNDLLNYEYDSTLVQVEGVLVGFTRNPEGEELEMQSGLHRYTAVLKDKSELREPPAIGSQLGLTGVYVGQGGNRVLDQPFNSFQLLLGSRSDIKILARPPWWNLRHSLVMLAATAFGLAGALTWIRTLRRRVELRTHELVQEIAEHERTESQLNEQTGRLEAEIQERNRAQLEVERVHRQLVDASRQAGQAEVAISVLHDVGNVLNSVNVSTSLITDYVRGFRLASLTKVTELLRSHAADLGYFMTADEKGRQLPEFLEKLGEHMHAQQEQLLEELKGLSQNVVHIKEIVTMQQDYAKPSDLSERVELAELVDSALTLQLASYQHDLISVVREFAPLAPVLADRHKVLQILVKLFENARGDFDASRTVGRQVIVRIRPGRDGFACLEVNDNGIGIATENLTRIFAHDFATHNGRHGLGLHSAALAAKEMKGSLLARSEGLGQGATLVLELPLQPPPAKATG